MIYDISTWFYTLVSRRWQVEPSVTIGKTRDPSFSFSVWDCSNQFNFYFLSLVRGGKKEVKNQTGVKSQNKENIEPQHKFVKQTATDVENHSLWKKNFQIWYIKSLDINFIKFIHIDWKSMFHQGTKCQAL